MKRFPGRGGSKRCAEAFGVSPQQWSPWERGMRTPDELRLQKIADFFEVTVEYLRRHNAEDLLDENGNELLLDDDHDARPQAVHTCPFYCPPPLGKPFSGEVRSMCWLADRIMGDIMNHGMPVRLSQHDIERLVERYVAVRTQGEYINMAEE